MNSNQRTNKGEYVFKFDPTYKTINVPLSKGERVSTRRCPGFKAWKEIYIFVDPGRYSRRGFVFVVDKP